MSNELIHYGVKGMKWGVRKDRSSSTGSKPKLSAKDFNDIKKGVDETNRSVSAYSNYRSNKQKRKAVRNATKNLDFNEMTDKELRDVVNRMNMEQQYVNLVTNKAVMNSGKSKVDRTLEVVGDVLTVTSSALAIAVAIKQLKG